MSGDSVKYAINRLLELEGKTHTKDPDDRGEETYCGITRKNFPTLKLWELLDQGQPDEVLRLHVHKFYTEWWYSIKTELISDEKLAVEYFFASVNCGKKVAIKTLQRSLNYLNRDEKDYQNILVDGVFGNRTYIAITALEHRRGLSLLRKMFNALMGAYYASIYEYDEVQEKFIGWIDRLWCEG